MDQPANSIISPPSPSRPPVRRTVGPSRRGQTPKQNLHVAAPWITAAAVVVLALVVLGIIPTSLKARPWQAVFLTNGQVYFGHVARQTFTTVVLRDVYYLQVSPSLQQRPADQPASPPDITLVKLGNELHGPADEMRINREHVLFTETLKDDATVVRAIATARERTAQLDASAVETPAVPGGASTAPETSPTNAAPLNE